MIRGTKCENNLEKRSDRTKPINAAEILEFVERKLSPPAKEEKLKYTCN